MRNDLPRELNTEVPVPSDKPVEVWGSDAVAEMLRALEIPYISLNPGASYKGFHDSLVNYLGNTRPQILLALHEESAVAIAHGYAKASERMMAATVHSNVGLMHATMSVFNAWCDRVPLMLIGATGPMDASKRRPWIEWIHTCADQGSLIRPFTKWDNQPASAPAAYEALLRAAQIANTAPRGPVYINLDVALQESKLGQLPRLPEVSRYRVPRSPIPERELVAEAAKLLSSAKRPLILAGRVSRSTQAWKKRVELAECLQAHVLTDLRTPASFPTDHALHPAAPGTRLTPAAAGMVRDADVILSLDWIDLGGTFKQAFGKDPVSAKIVHASCDVLNHRGWSMEYQILPPVDIHLLCEPDSAVPGLCEALTPREASVPKIARDTAKRPATNELAIFDVAEAFNKTAGGADICLTRVPIGWNSCYRQFRHPLDYLGNDGGAGLGSGTGMAVGAALALKGSGRIAAAILGDGEFLMGATGVWTAAHYRIPCLIVICNNRGYYNDEAHQEDVARERHRPVQNKGIGQRLVDPNIDIAMLARAQGAVGIGPIKEAAELLPAMKKALKQVQQGKVCVVDVHVAPGYE